MKLQDFLEKYLPNYHSDKRVQKLNALNSFFSADIMDGNTFTVELSYEYNDLQNKLFSEALKNILIRYTDDIRDYEHEAGQSISIIDDDRDSEEFVRIFLEKANS